MTRRLKSIYYDMWSVFINAVKNKAQQATLVFDELYIVKKITEVVNAVRL